MKFGAVAVGASAGGREALSCILARLPGDYPLPILVVQHLHASDNGGFAESLRATTALNVVTPCDKQAIVPGTVYVAPANYHLMIERTGQVALTVDEKVHWSRPSIDVLFESAARALGRRLIAVILSGANDDGAEGLRAVRAAGGVTMAQAPETAESPTMPQAAIDLGVVDEILAPGEIAEALIREGGTHD